jgi:hypothetical protein
MKSAKKYWFLQGNLDQWALGIYAPIVTLPRKYEKFFRAGYEAGQRGYHFPKASKRYGLYW